MQRRTLLQLGVGASLAVALVGYVATRPAPIEPAGRLSASARLIFARVGAAVLEGSLPDEPQARQLALDAMVDRTEQLIAGLSPATQAEVAELLAILGMAPGRIGLLGMASTWEEVSAPELRQQLQTLRTSRWGLRRQVYQALHEIVSGAYFVDAATWTTMGYPGPMRV